MAIAFTWLLLQRRIPIPASCIRTYVDFLIHDDIELRKVCFCRLDDTLYFLVRN